MHRVIRISLAALLSPFSIFPAFFLFNIATNIVDIYKLIAQGYPSIIVDRYLDVSWVTDSFVWIMFSVVVVTTVIFGVPAHLLLQSYGRTGVFSYAIAGVIGGFLVGATFLTTGEALATGLNGALVAVVFRFIAIDRKSNSKLVNS